MNIKNGIITGAMVLAIGMTSLTSVYASSTQQTNCEADIMICTTGSNGIIDSTFDFKELSKDFKENISKEDYKKAETLFNKANSLEEDASKYWDELYNLDLFEDTLLQDDLTVDDLNETDLIDMTQEFNFEEFAKELKKDITPEQKKKAEDLFSKAIKLDEDGKYDEAMKVWDKIYEMDLFDDMIITCEIEDIEPFTFEEFSKDLKKDVKPEVIKKAKELFNKANKLDEESMKVWDQLYTMDIFKIMDFECDK